MGAACPFGTLMCQWTLQSTTSWTTTFLSFRRLIPSPRFFEKHKKLGIEEPYRLWMSVVSVKGGRFLYWTRTYYTTRDVFYFHNPWELGVSDFDDG